MPEQHLNAQTGELEPVDSMLNDAAYQGIGTTVVNEQQQAILLREPTDDEIDILVSGEIYMSHVHVRSRLTHAFGPGGWGMRPVTREREEANAIEQMWALYARGAFLASAWGSSQWNRTNQRMNRTDALEAAKSNALTRCAKDLSIGAQCWEARWANAWRERMCVKVWVEGQRVPVWRRRDARPLRGETGIAEDRQQQQNVVTRTGPRNPLRPLPEDGARTGQEAPGLAQGAPEGAQASPEAPRPAYREPAPRAASPAVATPEPEAPAAASEPVATPERRPRVIPPSQTRGQRKSAKSAKAAAAEVAVRDDDAPPVDDEPETIVSEPEVLGTGTGRSGPWKLYCVRTDRRAYVMFDRDANGDATGEKLFVEAKRLHRAKAKVDVDFEKVVREDNQVNFKLVAIKAAK